MADGIMANHRQRGDLTTLADLGDPGTAAVAYSLCVYDESVKPQPVLSAQVAGRGICSGKRCWKRQGKAEYKFSDKQGNQDGLTQLRLRAGEPVKAKVDVRGRGAHLGVNGLPFVTPIVVQLHANDGAHTSCWSTTFATATRNDAQQFRAKDE